MKIGIIGGSIAGCSAAIQLMNEGYDITVFERSNKPLVGRGGGIGTTPTLMNQIKQDGLVMGDFAYFQINSMPFVGKSESHEPFGKIAWAMPMNFHVFQWNELWRKLREQVPDKHYHAGTQIVGAAMVTENKVELVTAEGCKEHFDLVLFADGYNSLGRSILFPEKKLKYRGYVLWRGLLPEKDMDGPCPLKDEILRLSYDREPGHNVVYFIPNQDGSVNEGERVFNWAAYIAVAESELTNLMTDKNEKIREGTLPPGTMSAANEQRLKDFLSKNIPQYYAEMVNRTNNSYVQVIYTLDLDTYYRDRICLIGDAGMVVQPFTGSGVFKGYNNVKDLIHGLRENQALEDVLAQWSKKQLQTGKRLLTLGEQMEKAYIWEQLDFAEVDEETTQNWWKESITFPDTFNYEKG